jgi:CBS domain containing-hemolysin-like protein
VAGGEGAPVTTRTDLGLAVASALLVVAAGVVACAESALTRVSRVHLDLMARERRSGISSLTRVLDDAARYLDLLFLLRTAATITAAVTAAVAAYDGLGVGWAAILLSAGATSIVEYLLSSVGRGLGRRHPGGIAKGFAPVLLALGRLLSPLSAGLLVAGNVLTPGRALREGPLSSEAELRDLVDLAEARQVIESDERAMIHSVFELGDTIAREVMVPRTEMVVIERTKTVRQALSLALRSGFSRIPVVGESEDDVVGVVYLKDLAKDAYEARDRAAKVDTVMRPAVFVPDSKPADDLLREMQARQIHLAVVVDEYGGTAGLVTIEDILEEIVGEITDEYDRELPPVEQVDEDTVRVTARLPVEDVEELFGVELDDEEVDTVAGLMAAALGRVPIPGATVDIAGLSFLAESAKGRRNRIGTVLIHRDHPDGAPAVEAADA